MYIIQTFPSYCCFGMCVFVCVYICAWRCGGSGRLCRGSLSGLSIDLRLLCGICL